MTRISMTLTTIRSVVTAARVRIDLDQSWEGVDGTVGGGTLGRMTRTKQPARGGKCSWHMAFEFATPGSTLRWFGPNAGGRLNSTTQPRRARWASADDAVMAAVRYTTGLAEWDRKLAVPDDLLRWRPTGENL